MSFQFKATFSSNPKQSSTVFCVNNKLEFLQGLKKDLANNINDYMDRVSYKAKSGVFGLKNSGKNAPILTTAVNNPQLMSKSGKKADGIEKI